jgi:hypothetical protein
MPKRGRALGKRDKPVKSHSAIAASAISAHRYWRTPLQNSAPVLAHAEKLWARNTIGVKHISIGFSDRPKGAAF